MLIITPTPGLPEFATLPRYYGYRDVLALYSGDWDRFLDAWVASGGAGLPEEIRATCRLDLPPEDLQVRLFERLLRQQTDMVHLLQDLVDTIKAAPTVETV